ncbi:ATP-NAD kinase-like domain-containing protein [Biscogniauxia marginata]|nr:ATP-NAD kinase-like domain-containing protein [Biscogniauxia marginata]
MSIKNENASNLIGSVKLEEVICILKKPQKPGEYDVFSLQEVSNEQGTSYSLSQVTTTDVLSSLVDGLVIDSLPEYLQSGQSQHVHVVVSTLSGTGLAQEFYQSVIKPLFVALGILATETPPSSTDPSAALAKSNSYNLVVTQNVASVREFARSLGESIQNGSDDQAPAKHTVVLLSGDGGVVEMLNGKALVDGTIDEPQLPLIAILPLGTGNALFNSLHKIVEPPAGSPVPSTLVQALRTLLRGRAAPLPSFKATFPPGSRTITYTSSKSEDAGRSGPSSSATATATATTTTEEVVVATEEENVVTEHSDSVTHLYGAIVASYGFHAQLVWESDTPEYRRHGAKRFGMVAQELLKENHAYRATVELVPPPSPSYSAGETEGGKKPVLLGRGRHAYVLATLVSNLEKTFCISPASRPLDGALRLVHFGPVGAERTMEIMTRAYEGGRHVGMRWKRDGDGGEDGVGYEDVAGELVITILEEDPRWRKVCVDGTIVEVPQGGRVGVRREEGAHFLVLVDRSVG